LAPSVQQLWNKDFTESEEAKSAHETEQQRDIRERFFVWFKWVGFRV
jgi:hypothetical protein